MSRYLIVAAIILASGATGEAGPIAVPLNHFYVTVDSETYRAIEADPFLRSELAASETRTTRRTDMSYSGLYFYGASTYFELFDASESPDRKLGASGVAFGVDRSGGLAALAREPGAELAVAPEPITRQFGERQVPWFFIATPKWLASDSGFNAWVMEYHPSFLQEWNPKRGGRGVERRQILRRYAAVLDRAPSAPILRDVVALTIALDDATAAKLVGLCRSLGYRSRAEGGATVLEGPDVRLRLIAARAEVRGVREITMRVNRKPKGVSERRFGASVLRFGDDGLAIWSF